MHELITTRRTLPNATKPIQKTINEIAVLVVDDDRDLRRILVLWLENLGCRAVLEAADGREALRIMRTADPKPDMIFLDVHMPFDGFSCCRTLRRDKLLAALNPFLVMITADSGEAIERQRFRSGANLVLTKPLTFMSMLQSVLVFLHRELEAAVRLGPGVRRRAPAC